MPEWRRIKQKQIASLEERLAEEAIRLRKEANELPPGAAREALLRRARQAETGSHMSEWLRSPGLQPPTGFSDAENAKRFRDKAAEALQMVDQAETESRRSTLRQIAQSYDRLASNLEGIATSKISSKK